jgi:hypothetical protein
VRWLGAIALVAAAHSISTDPALAGEPGDAKRMEVGLAPLDLFTGPWHLRQHHFNEAGDAIATVKGTEEIVWVLNGRAIRRTYTAISEPANFRAVGMLTWNVADGEYEGVWFDNVSTNGPTTVTATWNDDQRTLLATLRSRAADESPLEFKVLERFTDADHRVATTYRIRGSETIKLLEVEYTRAAPCPDRLRIIYDRGVEYQGQ